MNSLGVVTKDYISAYPDPIVIKKNDVAIVGHCDLVWRGWVWISLATGKAGWAPLQILYPISTNEVICLEDYTAQELSVFLHEQVLLMKSLNGWYWAKNASEEVGWVPQECISLLHG